MYTHGVNSLLAMYEVLLIAFVTTTCYARRSNSLPVRRRVTNGIDIGHIEELPEEAKSMLLPFSKLLSSTTSTAAAVAEAAERSQ